MGLSSQGQLTGLGVRWSEAGMRGCQVGLRNILFLWCSVSSAAWPDGEIYRETKRDREIKRERERNPAEHLHGFPWSYTHPSPGHTSARQIPSEICPASAFLTWGRSDEADLIFFFNYYFQSINQSSIVSADQQQRASGGPALSFQSSPWLCGCCSV